MQNKLIPLGDYVILKQIAAEETTKSGLILSEGAQEKPFKGEIMAVGPTATQVKVGDSVYYKQYAGDNFKVNGEDLIVMREDGIIAKEE